jgi:hypothetical protein
MEIKQHKNPTIDIKYRTNIRFIVFILTVIVNIAMSSRKTTLLNLLPNKQLNCGSRRI